MIPRRLIRTVPTDTTAEVEGFWSTARVVNDGWDIITFRDPIPPSVFPLTSPHWDRCAKGAQRAGLIRLEALYNLGGVYIDSDYECYRTFAPLLHTPMFAGWEDANTVPDAVIGAEARNPLLLEMIEVAINRIDQGPWASGPGVLTDLLPDRDDVLLLAPGSLYPYHYSERARRHEDHKTANPFAFGAHHWAASWLK